MKRNYWPHAIILYFVVFIGGVITWVIFASHHQDELVRADYYEQEIRFQEQIDRATRAAAFDAGRVLSFEPAAQSLLVELSPSGAVQGTVHLYRPSEAKLDQHIPLRLNSEGAQRLDLSRLESGLWKVCLSWKSGGRDYYLEKTIVARGR